MMTLAGRSAPHRLPRRFARRAAVVLAAAILAGALAAAPPAAAEEPGDADGIAGLRLERDAVAFQLAQMRRLMPPEQGTAPVERPAQPPPPAGGAARQPLPSVPLQAAPAAPLDEARRAGFEVRLSQLEEELRRLTGRIEQVEFEQQRMNERLDRLVADLDLRLEGLEAALRSGGGSAGQVAMPAPQPQPEVEAEERLAVAPPPEAEPALPTGPEAATTEGTHDAGDPITQYHAAMDLLRAGDYAAAATALDAFLAGYPDHELSANAAYWLAETHYVRRNYADAAATFARNYRTYGADAAKAPDNLLKLGMSLEALGDSERACQVFTELDNAFPEAPAHIGQAVARERARAGCT